MNGNRGRAIALGKSATEVEKTSLDRFEPVKEVPKIALPLARKYFRRQVESRKIELSTHHILIKEALTVLGRETSSSLLEQLLWGEINEVIISAQSEKLSWLMKNMNPDGWINLNEFVVFQSVNQAIAGILTIVATLPWSMQLNALIENGKLSLEDLPFKEGDEVEIMIVETNQSDRY